MLPDGASRDGKRGLPGNAAKHPYTTLLAGRGQGEKRGRGFMYGYIDRKAKFMKCLFCSSSTEANQ